MEEDKIRQLLEEIDPEGKISPDKIESFIATVKELEEHPLKEGTTIGGLTFDHLKEQMNNETDWRKKASIAAKIISLGLE